MENLLKLLREKAFDKKPTVEELKKFDGLDSVTAKERDEAWKVIQEEKQAQSKTNSEGDDNGDGGDGDSDKNTTTTTTTTTASDPDAKSSTKQNASPRYRVTVMRDGFRRLGRAWSGSDDVDLSEEEVAILEADPMFSVIEL